MRLLKLITLFFLVSPALFAASPISLEMPRPNALLIPLPDPLPIPELPQGGGQFGGVGGGAGLPAGCTSPGTGQLNCTNSLSVGSGASAAGPTATGGFAAVEATSTGWTPTVGQDYMRADSTSHAFLCSWNGVAEALCGGAAFPLTVTGGVSGGIPYFSSTTVESASPILNTGFLMKGGGAGNPPTNSLCDEGATTANTITCTDTAGIAAVKFVSTANLGGFIDRAQGPDPTGDALCATANSWCDFAGTAQTAFKSKIPSGPPTNNNSAILFSNANPAIETFAKMPQLAILTTQYTNSTTGFTNVTGTNSLAFPVEANTNYGMNCHLYYQAAATGGLNIEFTGPASPTAVHYAMDLPTALTAVASVEADAFATSIGAVSTNGAANLDAQVSFGLVNGANAGTVQMLAKSSAAVQLQIQAGSFCLLQ